MFSEDKVKKSYGWVREEAREDEEVTVVSKTGSDDFVEFESWEAFSLSLSAEDLTRWVSEGRLSPARVGVGRAAYRLADIEALLDQPPEAE